jgi:peptidoglycan hydrolase-like protein with peptidoglycan-binding domain
MRTLILATASAIALGIAAASPLYAADNTAGSPAAQTPAGGTMQPAAPQAGAMQQTPSMSGNSQNNSPDMASASQSSMDWPRVTSADVQQVQQKLQQDGLYRGKIDGLVGPGTQQALRTYQHKNGLPVTATLDPQTMNSLLGASAGAGAGVGSSTPPNSSNDTNITPPSNAGANGANTPSPTANH